MPAIPRLMLISPPTVDTGEFAERAAQAISGGVDAIQLRVPALSHTERRATTWTIIDRLGGADGLLINGDLPLAAETGSGLHLPERYPWPDDVRSRLKSGALVGRSVHSAAAAAASIGADYILAGHVFSSASKPGVPPLGLDGLTAIVAVSPVPVLAVGGITAERVGQVMATGAHGVAVISAIAAALEPRQASSELRRHVDQALQEVKSMNASLKSGPTIAFTVNGKAMTVPAGASIADLLRQRELDHRLVAVEHNGMILRPAQFPSTRLSAGDEVEIVHFVGGG